MIEARVRESVEVFVIRLRRGIIIGRRSIP
jgi:hypothetical protein